MKAKKLQYLRHKARAKQGGRCFYCQQPIWEENPEQFSRVHGLPARLAKHLKCTAEHLVAQQDKGRNTLENIVAACQWCNGWRHRGRQKKAPDPATCKARITALVAQGKGHPVASSKRVMGHEGRALRFTSSISNMICQA